MAEGDSEGFKKTLKITCQGSDGDVASFKGIDRLSDLPDCILHHILSFLDTKSLFRTSLLSRRWGCVWKEVPVLDFSCDKSRSSFVEHVLAFLSLRADDSAAVSRVTFKAWDPIGGGHARLYYAKLFDTVMKYAASVGTRSRSLHHLSMSHARGDCPNFVDLAAIIKAHHHHQSLETIDLTSFYLVSGGSGATPFSSFNLVTNLELHNCFLSSSVSSVVIEPFVDLPCIKHLKLVDCYLWGPPRLLKVSGSELLDLQIQDQLDRGSQFEVFAPKLKSFSFRGCMKQLIQLELPSLDHANIRVQIKQRQEIEATNRACLKLLPQLHNVESLSLGFDKRTKGQRRWKPHEFPLISSTELLPELEVSPFNRLRNLTVWYPQRPPSTIPYQVIRYFFEGSPHTIRKFFKFEKKPE